MVDKRPIIGVMGSREEAWEAYAAPVGRLIAEYDYHLLTGAGGGVMSAVAKAFTEVEERAGHSIGIVPTVDYDGSFVPREKYPNAYIEIPVLTPLDRKASGDVNPYSRNYVNVMTSNALVILPGEHGTQNEVALALQYKKQMVLFGPEDAFKGFPEQVTIVEDIEAVREFLDTVQVHFREDKD